MSIRPYAFAAAFASLGAAAPAHAADSATQAKLQAYAHGKQTALAAIKAHADNPLLRSALGGKRSELSFFWWPGKNYSTGRSRSPGLKPEEPGQIHELVLKDDGLFLKTTTQVTRRGESPISNYTAASVDGGFLRKKIDPAWLDLARDGSTAEHIDKKVNAWVDKNLP